MSSGCGEQSPVQLGFVAGMSGKTAALGTEGRDGVILAVEEWNARGGVNGNSIELLIEDVGQDKEKLDRSVRKLIDKEVEAIVGPMTSAMAVAALPVINQAEKVMVGASTTSTELSARDDFFFRTIPSVEFYANANARHQLSLGLRKFAVVMDLSNAAYAISWADSFGAELKSGGGEVSARVMFNSADQADFPDIAASLLESNPDGVAFVTNSDDTAMIAMQVRKLVSDIPLAAAAWSATDRLMELGVNAVEGMIVEQMFDRHDKSAGFTAFRRRFVSRFGREPSLGGTVAYNAANVVLKSMAEKEIDEHLKNTILRIGKFPGLQYDLIFDEFGDLNVESINPASSLAIVRNGLFQPIE